ncbi:hypothetical protein D3C74_401650 [compost metagenome]
MDLFRHDAFLVLLALHLHDGLMIFRVKRLSYRFHSCKSFRLQYPFQLLENHIHAFVKSFEFRSSRSCGNGPFEVVQYRKQFTYELGGGILRQFLFFLLGTAAEVVKISLHTQRTPLIFIRQLLQAFGLFTAA